MDVNSFLAGLPALLGFTGFVIYQVLQRSGSANPIVTDIVGKLRKEAPERFPDQRLRAAQVERLLAKDSRLRQAITDQDFVLLKKVLNQQFWTGVFVYIICAGLFIFGVIAYLREVGRTKVRDITIDSQNGEPVDLDPLIVRWKSEGEAQLLTVYLENIQTGQRSKAYHVHSADRSVTFCRTDYAQILAVRSHGGHNRVRVVLESPSQTYPSGEFGLLVGVVLLLVATPEKITLAATVDNTLIQGYQYEAKILLHRKSSGELVSLGGEITAKQDFNVKNPASIDWALTKIVYLGPDDQKIVRPSFIIDHSLGLAPPGDQSGCANTLAERATLSSTLIAFTRSNDKRSLVPLGQ
jgi:hypothetical protein